MGDDTGYPSSCYPGGSEDDFNNLRRELAQTGAERNEALRDLETTRAELARLREENARLEKVVEAARPLREAVFEFFQAAGIPFEINNEGMTNALAELDKWWAENSRQTG